MEEKLVFIINEMTEYLSITQLKKLQEVLVKALVVDDAQKQIISNDEYLKLFLDAKKIESSGDIGLSLKKYHKYTMAFDKELTEVDFDIDFVSFSREKRIINCITKLDFASMQNAVSKFNPIILEEMNIDFEELFVLEVQNRGYLK